MKPPTLLLFATVCLACQAMDYSACQRIHVIPGQTGATTFPTLEDARNHIRAARTDGRLDKNRPIAVLIAPGTYSIASSLNFRANDAGQEGAPIVWAAEKKGTVRFRGGTTLPPSAFSPVTEKSILERLPEAARGKALVCDVSAHLPGDLAPWPNQFNQPPAPWLYIDGEPAVCARWPNADAEHDGWAHFTKSVDTGYPTKDIHSNARTDMHPGAFQWEFPERGARWNFAAGIWIYGYWTHDWAENSIRAKGFENTPSNRIMRLAGTHVYGCGNGTWGAKKRRFFVYNLLEELDAPGEWHLDRTAKKLYVIPTANWHKADIVLATSEQPFIDLRDASDIIFRDLAFEHSHSAQAAVRISNGTRIGVVGCTFSGLAGSALGLTGTDCRIVDCEARNLGGSGFSVNGGDRKRLVPANNLVANCHIHHYARFCRTYAPAIGVGGCGQRIVGCRIHHAPHNAILYGGNNHLFESNEVYRVLLETGDAGAFYTGRDTSTLGTVIRGNHFHDLGRDPNLSDFTMAIYFDDCDWGDAVYDNIFERAGKAVFIGGGNLHPVVGNIFIECPVGVHIDTRGVTWREGKRKAFNFDKDGVSWYERMLKPHGFRSEIWRRAYPEIEGLLKDRPDMPRMNPITNNVFIACKKNFAFDPLARTVTNECPVRANSFFPTRQDAIRAGVKLAPAARTARQN
ncbi:MAG: right-handed parallel beta-helix repeat-containing protein [Kiritimatiellia bacterium]